MRAALTLALAAAISIGGPAVARAQRDGAQAEALFDQGKRLMTAGKYGEACLAFESSQKLDPAVTTLINHADCREKNQQLATAYGLFIEAERETRGSSDPGIVRVHALCADRAAKLLPRLSRLAIKVPAEHRVDGLVILRDGVPVPEGAWNNELPVDGGSHKITARAEQFQPWTIEVTVKPERDGQSVEVPRLEPAPVQPAPSAQAPARRRSLVAPLAFGGAAIGLAGGAVGFLLWGNSIYADSRAEVDEDRQDELWKSANTRRYVAQGLGVAAIGCAGAAVYLVIRGRAGEQPAAAGKLTVQPVVGRGAAGVVIGRAW